MTEDMFVSACTEAFQSQVNAESFVSTTHLDPLFRPETL